MSDNSDTLRDSNEWMQWITVTYTGEKDNREGMSDNYVITLRDRLKAVTEVDNSEHVQT